ncbi:MAG: PDZ domain-containing protein [Clostridiales bacterium]|nr:PDZ domain-containing protein [Clostridiales bacterium]
MEQSKETGQENGMKKPDSDFITEKIKQRPIDKKKLLRRTIITAAMAVIFALVACLTFLILEPVLSNWLYPEEEPAPIEFPAETEEMLPEDMIVDDSEMTQAEQQTEIELQDEQIAQVLDNINLSSDDYSAMYNGLADVAKEAAKSVVTVTGSVSNLDWFNDPYESKDQTSGIVVANQGKEIFILVNYEKLKGAETIMVTFSSGEQVQAQLKQQDNNTKLAVISVAESDVSKETLEGIVPANLTGSSSNNAIIGRPVIAVGSPLGTSDSICYGIITSNNTTLNMMDSYYKILTTDIYGSQDASGVLVNLSGQVLGIIDNTHNSEDMKNLVSAIGITELRRKIEKMSNEKEQAYLGTYGTDVTIDANERLGVPYGAYITEIEMDSPAMAAGIQSGDIITAIGDKEIKTYGDLVGTMIELLPDESVAITLMRQGPEEYLQMEVNVTLGKLK